MKKETRTKFLFLVPLFLILLTPLIILVLFRNVSKADSQDNLLVESAKALLQLIGVAVIGGGIKLLYDDFIEQRRQVERSRDQERAQAEKVRDQERAQQVAANDIRKGLLNDLIEARSQVEEARFKYRIEEILDPVQHYRGTVLSILGARLSLSRIWNAIHTSTYLFADHDDIKKNLREMKDYLDTLINEYEIEIENVQQAPKESVVNYLRHLPVFGDFVKATDDENLSNYGQKFLVDSYRPAVEEIRKEVLRASEFSLTAAPSLKNRASSDTAQPATNGTVRI